MMDSLLNHLAATGSHSFLIPSSSAMIDLAISLTDSILGNLFPFPASRNGKRIFRSPSKLDDSRSDQRSGHSSMNRPVFDGFGFSVERDNGFTFTVPRPAEAPSAAIRNLIAFAFPTLTTVGQFTGAFQDCFGLFLDTHLESPTLFVEVTVLLGV